MTAIKLPGKPIQKGYLILTSETASLIKYVLDADLKVTLAMTATIHSNEYFLSEPLSGGYFAF